MSDYQPTGIFLRDIDSDELVVKCLEAYLWTWAKALQYDIQQQKELNLPGVFKEINYVVKDLGDRKKRMRDRDFSVTVHPRERSHRHKKTLTPRRNPD